MDPGHRETDSAALQPRSSRARAMRARGGFDRSQDGLARLGGVVRAPHAFDRSNAQKRAREIVTRSMSRPDRTSSSPHSRALSLDTW